ncbi:MAG: MBL fold metallo-hydrolase [Gemmatimonadota bacterium]|nr:MBL fold metallo-hydrolase [Gemmatimonadota bacterium]
MIFRRLYDDELAQASYLIGCEVTRRAIVVDPTVDAARYTRAATDEGLTITHVAETHIHADFVSGARTLAMLTEAALCVSAEGGPEWRYRLDDRLTIEPSGGQPARLAYTPRLLRHGDTVDVGTLRLTVLHTPGHTPEHVSYLVADTTVSDEPIGVLSGDFIFVGDVGRPDLLERAAGVADTMEPSARRLFASLQAARSLPDYLQLWPGHGAGSACGKALGSMPQSTLGFERLTNAALRATDEDAFVRDILTAQPEPPRYFARMKRVNRDGAPDPAPEATAPELSAAELDAAIAGGGFVVDTRPSAWFMSEFVPGTICVPKSKSFTSYFGSVAPEECPVVLLVAREEDLRPLALRLHHIGFDRVAGWAVAGEVIADRRAAGLPVWTLQPAPLDDVRRRMDTDPSLRLVDVRNAAERSGGVIPGSLGISLGDLAGWGGRAPREAPVVVQCHTGTRSVIGASVLRAAGFTDVTPMAGGYDAWTAAGLPVVRPSDG